MREIGHKLPISHDGIPQYTWRRMFHGTDSGGDERFGAIVSLGSLAANDHRFSLTNPLNSPIVDGKYATVRSEPSLGAEFKFFGGDADNETAHVFIWGISEIEAHIDSGSGVKIEHEYAVDFLADLDIVLGAGKATNTKALLGPEANRPSGTFLADTITVATSEANVTPIVTHDQAEGWATLELRNQGFGGYLVQVLRNTASWVDVLFRNT